MSKEEFKHYPLRKKVDVHTAIGSSLWREVERMAGKHRVSKVAVLNSVLAEGFAALKQRPK